LIPRLVCRLTYSGLLKSIVQQANFVYENRYVTKPYQYEPHYKTSILCLQASYKVENKDAIRQFLESQHWYTLWSVLGDDVFRHLLLNCVMLFHFMHPDFPNTDRSVYIQLCGRLFTAKVQKFYLLPRYEEHEKTIHTLSNVSYNTIPPSYDCNPLLKRYHCQMKRCREKKKIQKQHTNVLIFYY
jgi:hypothetical protein